MNSINKLFLNPEGSNIALNKISKSFGSLQVLNQIDLSVQPGELIALVGRSGCGKSTLLRILAGLDQPSQGDIDISRFGAQGDKSDIRLMFQDDRLLPWKTVVENVGLGLSGNWHPRAKEALSEVGLADKLTAWPSQLSGGQRQRVALARALIHRPNLLLLDEPLGALDALTRIEMQQLIEKIWHEHGFTLILVTHDVSEAVLLADRVIVLEEGQIGLDLSINLPRSRQLSDTKVTSYVGQLLQRVLGKPSESTDEQHTIIGKTS